MIRRAHNILAFFAVKAVSLKPSKSDIELARKLEQVFASVLGLLRDVDEAKLIELEAILRQELETTIGGGMAGYLPENQIAGRAFRASEATTQRVIGKINETLASGIRAGLTEAELGKILTTEVKDMAQWEIDRIVRTEVRSAQNEAAFNGLADAGVEYHKWITVKDNNVRPSHEELDGLIVAVGDPWPNGLYYPGDRSGPIEEWINCRCVAAPWFMPAGKMPPIGADSFKESQIVSTTRAA